MALRREALRFLLVGALLVAVDALVFMALSALGLEPGLANLAGRLSGAALGFLAHGGFTFAGADARLGGGPLARYALLWLALTLLSTLAVAGAARSLGLATAWLLKPPLEVLLAVASFLLMRHWVYR
ncbi:MAG: GtrA family protein [Xanthomonadales bacterium]|nr:GtrA family protein [Xanthomonadales bacterium]